jgi:hypothetical protein
MPREAPSPYPINPPIVTHRAARKWSQDEARRDVQRNAGFSAVVSGKRKPSDEHPNH